MTDREEGVLSRWSRRKRESEPTPGQAETPATDGAESAQGGAVQAREGDSREMLTEDDLPDIDSLDFESDFSDFLQDNVPRHLKNLALNKLWRSAPVLANVDGLNDYDLNYSLNEVMDVAMQSAEDLKRGSKRRNETDLRGQEQQADGATADSDGGAEAGAPDSGGETEAAAHDGEHGASDEENGALGPDDDHQNA